MSIVQHRFIQNRDDFFRVLAEELVRAQRFEAEVPGLPLFSSLRRQLEAITQWTADGRQPTKDERRSIQMGPLIVRELNPAPTDELEDFGSRIQELEFYLKHWRDDAGWQSLDDGDYEIFFPDDHAP
ncbi:MAG: hypothetical protein H6719_28275 [Sandaracinaceae bacterium]|nr:hypothetical protein [Sandaracinaceae bacterium]